MAVFTLADLHLSFSTNKPMDVFGSLWENHAEKIEEYWNYMVDPEDTVVVPGDISWAMTLPEALSDFQFLEALPGRKLIGSDALLPFAVLKQRIAYQPKQGGSYRIVANPYNEQEDE